jgi:hypothetical protein
MATLSQQTPATPNSADDIVALRADLISKMITHASKIQKAYKKNPDNIILQSLDTELKQLSSYIKSTSVIQDSRLSEFSSILNDIIVAPDQPDVQPESAAPKEPVAPEEPQQQVASTPQEPVVQPEPEPVASQETQGNILDSSDEGDNLLGLDLEGMLGDIISEDSDSSGLSTEQDDFILRIDGDKIVLKIDDELEKGLDEEAKMFEVEKYFRNKEYFKALTVALALNIRFKQGVGRRSDAIVKRQDDVIFQSNYMIAYDYLGKMKTTKGDQRIENQLLAIMHLYAALDQEPIAGQEKVRAEMKSVIEKMIERERAGGQAFIKAGFFKKINVPSPEDKAQKSLYWKDRSVDEADALKKEFYLLMTFASDLTYYPYQIALANFYVETNRLDEACRYIQIPLPLIKEEGLDFMTKLKQKNSEYAESFIERRIASDINQLRNKLDQPDPKEMNETDPAARKRMASMRFRKFLDMWTMWQKQLDMMSKDVLYKTSTLRMEYLKAFIDLYQYTLSHYPNAILDDYQSRYKSTDVRGVQNPNIITYIDFNFRYCVVPDDMSVSGLSLESSPEAEEMFESLCRSVVEQFNIEIGLSNKDLGAATTKVDLDVEHLVKAMGSMGYKFESQVVLTRS